MGFVFYDTETTGTDTVFDQILQFAAIRTDEELNELERFNVRCRLLPHVVPSPGAMRVTGVTASQLINAELPTHYAMVRAIRDKLLSWGPALFIGYNSLDFDEHLLRQAFYQTLHPPYLTNTSGNCRADALRMVRAVALFAPNVLAIPLDREGVPSFKLDELAPANGYDHVNAHDALGDVHATIHLCKLLSQHAPELWSSFLRFTQKSAVIDHVADELVFSLSDFFFGRPYSWLVTSIGMSPSRKSDVLVFDLAVDPDRLRPLADQELVSRFSILPKIVRRIRSNGCPIIMPPENAPDIAAAKAIGMFEIERRARLLQNDQDLRERFVRAFEQTRVEYDPWPHVEQQIHDSFISELDKQRIERFHIAPWEDRLALLDQVEDLRLKQLGRRLVFFERPDVLTDEVRKEMVMALSKRMVSGDGNGAWRCIQGAIQESDDLMAVATAEDAILLQGHRDYLAQRLAEMST